MLEQRRAKEKGYITLREAAEISNYAPDYIGQLIRSGKIKGEQVYSNVAWVTTEEELLAYSSNKNRQLEPVSSWELLAVQASEKFLAGALYALIGILICVLLVLQYIFYVSLEASFVREPETKTQTALAK